MLSCWAVFMSVVCFGSVMFDVLYLLMFVLDVCTISSRIALQTKSLCFHIVSLIQFSSVYFHSISEILKRMLRGTTGRRIISSVFSSLLQMYFSNKLCCWSWRDACAHSWVVNSVSTRQVFRTIVKVIQFPL